VRDGAAGPDRAALKARCYFAALLILSAGLAAGMVLYLTGDEGEAPAASYVMVDGVAYPIAAQASKTYVRDLRRFGGKASLVFDDFQRWFAALWRGRQLGLTIGVLSAAVAALLFLVARYRL
jgi:hypothetical protein